MKIDTEGTEYRVLEGAKNVISKDRPIIFCEVLEGMTEKALQQFFQHTDYEFFWITDKGLILKEKIEGDPKGEFLNYLLIPRQKRIELQSKINLQIVS
jgi:hypothetical protein